MKTVINNKVYITKEDYKKTHKDFKGKIDGKENITALCPETGATCIFPVVFIDNYNQILKVKNISDDGFGRPRLQNIETKKIYADISCGDANNAEKYIKVAGDWNKLNIDGDWHTTSKDGEPDCPLKESVIFKLIK